MTVNTSRYSLTESAELRDAVIHAIEKGMSARGAMLALGLTKDTISEYGHAVEHGTWHDGRPLHPSTLETIKAFMERVVQARAVFEHDMVVGIYDDANKVNERTGQRDWKARAWLVERNSWTREHWHPYQEPQEINLNVKQIAPEFREAKELTDAELLEGIDPEWQQLLGEGKG